MMMISIGQTDMLRTASTPFGPMVVSELVFDVSFQVAALGELETSIPTPMDNIKDLFQDDLIKL
jgi:hypothetical protein